MRHTLPLAALLIAACFAGQVSADETLPEPPGLGDPGSLQSIQVDTGRTHDGMFIISGRDSGQQLVITGHYATGQVRDLSRDVTYTIAPEGVAKVDKTGWVSPIAEGKATIHIKAEAGSDTVVDVQVADIEVERPINFPNQVTPIFTKYGCNGGGCHGKSGGQNGFALSLLGFEPQEDYEHLVKEARGRRLFPAAPERSLLLTKASAQVPHGGGHRIDVGSPSYKTIARWIKQGMPYGSDEDPVVTHIEVLPQQRLMPRNGSQQLTVIAHYSDGTSEDVTRTTQFDSNDTEMAEVSETGLVTTSQMTGSVSVMARYQIQVGVYQATVPLGLEVDKLPAEKNFIDELVFKKLKALGLPPSEVCDDETFIRRVTVDLAGRLPTAEETEAFLASGDTNKRENWVDQLLDSPDYAEYFATKWGAILRNKRRQDTDKQATYAFNNWIRESLQENKPYDQFVRDVVAATGDPTTNPPSAWYREVKDQGAQVEDTAQLFLGLRIQCARCHHHPFEQWSQQDYYGFAAFFAQVGRKKGAYRDIDRIYHKPGNATARNPKTGDNVPPTGLGSEPLELDMLDDPRQSLADWMSSPDNPFFAKALVNRYWKHFFSRGLVDPEDDMRVTNPAVNPELLDALAKDFIEYKFDMKHLVRQIVNSNVYQLASEPNAWNQNDKQNFSRYYPKRLDAEVLLDSIDQVTGTETNFNGMPRGTRAVSLPDNGFDSYFLTVFGRPESSSACECERSGEANLAQSLHLLNSNEIQGKLTSGSGMAAQLSNQQEMDNAAKIRQLYMLAFSREPTAEEINVASAHIEKSENPKLAFEDVVWALINTKEFLFNH